MKGLVERAEGVFRLIVEEAQDFAIILLDPTGRVETWNRGAQRIFGYREDEVIGRSFELLFTAFDRAEHVPEREIEVTRESGRMEHARWMLRRDGRTLFADGIMNAVRDESGELIGFAKICRDVTERYRTEQRLAAQLALTNLLNEEQPFREIAHRVMQTISESLGWDIGILWDLEPGDDRLTAVDVWTGPTIDPAAAQALADARSFRRGEGLPGLVLESGQPKWVTDFTDVTRYPRAQLAIAAGVRAAFGFPITIKGHVAGVMEFFARVDREPDQALLPAMALIGAQIGDYLERRRTSQALRDSEERYRVVVQTAQDAIFTIDASSTILFCNDAVERVLGYQPDELIGHNLDVIIPEHLREAHRRGIERYIRTREKHIAWSGIELPAVHKDGREVPVEISFGERASENGADVFTGFARDITERKRAAVELQRSLEHAQQARAEAEGARAQLERRADEEASFRHLASALTGAVEMTEVLYEITNRATMVTRADGVYVERIVDAVNTVEVVASAGRGTPPRGLRVSFPGSLTEEILKDRQPVIVADMTSFGRSMAPYLTDTCADCEVLVTPLIAEEEPLGALVLLNSRTSGRSFKDTDIVRVRTLGDLTSLALRRVRLLEQEREAKEKAEQAVRVRDETLGIVSHDLRNPLTKIALSADLLVDTADEEQRELIETIRSGTRQMQRLIQDLLDVARLEAGRFSVDMIPLDPEPVVREACESSRPLAADKKLKLLCEIASPLPKICGDRDRLLQVFGNLIGNAMKFTPERGTVTVEARPHNGSVLIAVRDTGPGIPEADLKNVFRPYWQAKKTAHMGAGLGLAIVRGIIEAHGGRVWAENARGGGAVFTFIVPPV